MKVLDRKLLREVRGTGSLLIAIISVIAVGVMCFVYMRSAWHNLRAAQASYYAQCRMADFSVEVKKAPLAELARLAELPGIIELRPRIQFYATVDLPRSRMPLNGLVLSLPDRRTTAINDIVLKRGGYFTDRRDNEVILNDAFATRHDIHPGQWIHLILNNRRQELFVVGTAMSSEFVFLVGPGSMAPDPEHFGVFYLKRTYAEEIFDFSGACNQILGILSPDLRERPEGTLSQLEAMLEPYGVMTTTPRHNQLSNRFLSDEIRGLGVFATVMPIIFLLVGALVLNVLMTRLIEQQRPIVGMLKSLGYTDWQIFVHFGKYGATLGLMGGVLGLIAGNRMAIFVTELYKTFFEFPDLRNHFYPGTYLGGLGISLLCALIGSLHGARYALRLQPAEAMRTAPPPRGGAILLEHWQAFWRWLSFGWRLAMRNIFRQRLRSAVGIFAAAMGAALLLTGFTLQGGMQYMVNFQFELVSRSDLDLTFADERSRAALLEAQRFPAVEKAEPLFDLACTFVAGHHRRRGAVTGVDRNATLTIPRDIQGRPIRIPAHGISLARKLAELLDVRAGDLVTVVPNRGKRQPLSMRVAEVTDSYIGMSVYADIDYLCEKVGEEMALTGVQLKLSSLVAEADELARSLKQLPSLRSVSSRTDTIKNLQETVLDAQKIFITLLVIFAAVIFLSSLLNMSLINLAERRREVATLRVLGYTEWQVGGLFLRESLLLNLVGTVVGLPLGYALAWWITIVYDTEMFRFPLVTPPAIWVKVMVLGFVFALVAHAVVQRSVSRLDWLEASKTRE